MTLHSMIPDPEVLLAVEPEEIAGIEAQLVLAAVIVCKVDQAARESVAGHLRLSRNMTPRFTGDLAFGFISKGLPASGLNFGALL